MPATTSSVFDTTTPPTPEALANASECIIYDESGKEIKLGELYREQKSIAIWIRHFHCGLCQEFLLHLASKFSPDTLRQSNVNLFVIGCGDYTLIKGYKELLQFPFDIYADPSMKTYVALGMTLKTFAAGTRPEYQKTSPFGNVVLSITNAFKMGNLLKNAGPLKQLGGEFILGPGNQIIYSHRMENTRDHATIDEIATAAGITL